MNRFFTLILLAICCTTMAQQVKTLDKASFSKQVWDIDNNREWKYLGQMPCILFFTKNDAASVKVETSLAGIAKQYSGKIIVYKINAATEKELSIFFKADISAFPTLVFVPKVGEKLITLRGEVPLQMIKDKILEINKI